MKFAFTAALSAILAAGAAVSFPIAGSSASAHPSIVKRAGYPNAITQDAPFSVTAAQFAAVDLVCPFGVKKEANKNMLFIQGTGEQGDDAFADGLVPAYNAQGFGTCYALLPNQSIGDGQVTAEYVVNLIDRLYEQAGNNEIIAVGHSQGNLDIQWALNFYPSRRNKVSRFLAFAADFHGTWEGPLITVAQQALIAGASPSVIQQSVLVGQETNFLKALNKHGNTPLVPTTSVYGAFDEIIQPVGRTTKLDNVPIPNSFAHIDVSVACVGRTAALADHFRMLISAPAFWIGLDAIQNGVGDVTRAKALAAQQKQDFCADIAPGTTNGAGIPSTVKTAFLAAIRVITNNGFRQTTRTEPELFSYAKNQP